MILCITTCALVGPGPRHEFMRTAKKVIVPSTHPWLYMATNRASRFQVHSKHMKGYDFPSQQSIPEMRIA